MDQSTQERWTVMELISENAVKKGKWVPSKKPMIFYFIFIFIFEY